MSRLRSRVLMATMAMTILVPSVILTSSAPAIAAAKATAKASNAAPATHHATVKHGAPLPVTGNARTTLPAPPEIAAPAAEPSAPKANVLTALRPLLTTPTATCTETWTGDASDGEWDTAGNWSPVAVPRATDFACIGAGAPTVTVAAGTNTSILGVDAQGAGLVIESGGCCGPPSAVVNLTGGASDVSLINGLTLDGTLDSSVPLGLSGTSIFAGGTLSGANTTTLGTGSSTTVEAGAPTSVSGSIDNQGALGVNANATLTLAPTSQFDNDTGGSVLITGTFTDA
jgi:hypothetical protein